MAEMRKVVVTLVYASQDEDTADDIADGLRSAGREVALVAGVDEQPRVIGDALECCGKHGLVVLCTSAALDGPLLRKAEGLFSARRGPGHAMVRIDLANSVNDNVAAIARAYEGFVSSQGRITRRSSGEGPTRREFVTVKGGDSVTRPVVRLPPGEGLEGDTRRIDLPDNPKSKELARRRRVVRERARERERITGVHDPVKDTIPADLGLGFGDGQASIEHDEARLDRMIIAVAVGAGILAGLAAWSLAG